MTGEIRPRRRAGAPLAGAGALLVWGAVLAGCSLFYQRPTVRIVDVRLGSLGLTEGSARLSIEVVNPNGFELTVEAMRYALELEEAGAAEAWETLAEGSSERAVLVGARDTARVEVEVPFRYRAIGTAVVSYLRRGEVSYRLTGNVRVRAPSGASLIPFERRGVLDF